MNFNRLQIANRHGYQLAARIDLPVDDRPVAYAIFAHCFTCTKNFKAVANISQALNRAGIAVLRFDFTGLGESEGDFADTNFSTNISDLVDAADYMAGNYGAPEILIGHSFGGAAVIQAAEEIESAKAVAVIGAPADVAHVLNHLTHVREDIEKSGEAEVELGGRPFRIKKQLIDNLESQQMTDSIAGLRRALMVLHSPLDRIVGIENAARIFKAAKHPKSFVSLDKADHLMSDPEDSTYAGAIIAAWARKYISRTAAAGAQRHKASHNHVIAWTGTERYRTEILAGGHDLVGDEPEQAGGGGLGPSPYDMLLASLGACTAITLRMYADRKKWPLDAVRIRLAHSRIHAEQCADCDKGNGKLDQIDRQIRIEGDLEEKQRKRLLEIAERCPVHRSLERGVRVVSRLEGDEGAGSS
jgi:putative redox protein